MTFKVATATNAKSVSWKNRTYTWDDLVKRFTSAKVTEETYREFMAASKAEQGAIKDVGAFMGGELFGSRRNKNSVGERSLLALDIDYGEADFPERFFAAINCACIIHGTHKHNPKAGTLRYLVLVVILVIHTTFQREHLLPVGGHIHIAIFCYSFGTWVCLEVFLSSLFGYYFGLC